MSIPTREQLEKALCDNPHILQRELADMFGVSERKIPYILRKHGLKTARSTGRIRIPREDLEKALKDYPGISIRCMAKLLGSTRTIIERSLHDNGLSTENHGSGQKRVIEAYKKGADTPSKMARRLDTSETIAKRWMILLDLRADSKEMLATLPPCRICGDPVQQGNGTWEGEGDVHWTCMEYERRRAIMYVPLDEIL